MKDLVLKVKNLKGVSKKTGEPYDINLLVVNVNLFGQDTEITLTSRDIVKDNLLVSVIKNNK